jgi:hypothetical protein
VHAGSFASKDFAARVDRVHRWHLELARRVQQVLELLTLTMSDVNAPAPGVNAKPLCLYEHPEAFGAGIVEPPPEVIRANPAPLTCAAALLGAIELDDSDLGHAAVD